MWVVEVGVQPDRMVLFQHGAQRGRDALRQHHRQPAPDADDLDVRDRAERAEQPVEVVVGEDERVAAGEQHVADGGRAGDVGDAGAEVVLAHHEVGIAHHALAQAVAAVDGALARDAKGDFVGVVVDEVFDRAVAHLVQRIGDAHDVGRHLAGVRHHLPAHRARRVRGVHERGVVRRDGPPKHVRRLLNGLALAACWVDKAFEILGGAEAVAHLPAPVVPLGLRGVGHRKEKPCGEGVEESESRR